MDDVDDDLTDDLTDGLRRGADGTVRCGWAGDDPLYLAYHDTEWGRPVHDEHRLFEKLCLEGFQAGLSWLTILRKRDAFREVFAGFDPEVVAGFGAADVERLLSDARIVRHRGKIEATIANARAYGDLVADVGSLDAHVWSYAPDTHTPPRTRRTSRPPRPRRSPCRGTSSGAGGGSSVPPPSTRSSRRWASSTITWSAAPPAPRARGDHLVGCASRTPRTR